MRQSYGMAASSGLPTVRQDMCPATNVCDDPELRTTAHTCAGAAEPSGCYCLGLLGFMSVDGQTSVCSRVSPSFGEARKLGEEAALENNPAGFDAGL